MNNDTVSDFNGFRALLMSGLKYKKVIEAYVSMVLMSIISFNKNIILFNDAERIYTKEERLEFERFLWTKGIQIPDPQYKHARSWIQYEPYWGTFVTRPLDDFVADSRWLPEILLSKIFMIFNLWRVFLRE
jgi:hypothetical protein